ncbi:hypothetical protein [Sporomusa acidovorans]|uniref:Copper amine oxidase-like N-terminal domain-containing protein n=1 Tax=Sporomusa acidovorans (strain ATCC 49682 / DSM 3132 / Mol) TaxID=1123286 RepID=A0ABZ3J6J1_SPOA4|nr:hypothetical protein [Sporomusa acidovorans]OZC15662.1 hypothetical protein SPACI_47370 [Sporomusa acidovorans DSM 3132]SDE88436.1 hypothetical protein SAMN04488499_102534 [Sporomusa acidovorans]
MKPITWIVYLILLVVNLGSEATAADGPSGLDIENLPEWPAISQSNGGKLLFSDSPEMVNHDGILYQDKIAGSARLFFYHVNDTNDVKKMSVLLENRENKPAHVAVRQAVLGGPGYSWFEVGKETQRAYFAEKNTYTVNVPPGGTIPLSANIEKAIMMPNMLINGIYDFTVDGPITVKVIMLPVNENSITFSQRLAVLPADRWHLRGTFAGANRIVSPIEPYDPVHDGAIGLTLADNAIDSYLKGIDATDGSEVVNYGNYGVVYQVLLPSKKGGRISYYLAPMGGEFAGAIKINHPEVYWSPLPIPRDKLYFGDSKKKDFAFLGTFEGGDPLSLTFSPPGASNLPVRIIALPQ